MRRFTLVLALTISAGLLAGCSSPRDKAAKNRPPMPEGAQVLKPAAFVFMGFDTNGDYAISREEFNTGIRHTFMIVDSDGSGMIELMEYQNWSDVALGSRYASPTWERVNRNGSGGIDEIEFISEFTQIATEYGLSTGDGLLLAELTGDMQELMASMRANMRSSGGRMPGGRGMPGGGRGGGGGMPGGQFPLDVAQAE